MNRGCVGVIVSISLGVGLGWFVMGWGLSVGRFVVLYLVFICFYMRGWFVG